jgi:hypothetical protein
MAGYIGTKAVNLSTTGADINGNANVDGSLDVLGAFTSTGITVSTNGPKITLDDTAGGTQEDYSLGVDFGAFTIKNETTTDNIQVLTDTVQQFYTSGSERMRIDDSGNVGIGTTPSSLWNSSYDALQIGQAAAIWSQVNTPKLFATSNLYLDETGNFKYLVSGQAATSYSQTGGVHSWGTAAAGTAGATTSLTESLRIDASGNVLVGKTAESFGTVGGQILQDGRSFFTTSSNYSLFLNRQTTTGSIQLFSYNNAQVGSISVTASATAYNTSSDYRLKENVTPIQGAGDIVKAMRPATYTFKADGSWTDGFIAHELQELHPAAVTGSKDEVDEEGNPVYQGVDYSKLTPILTAALQEALNKIEVLEARIVALEAKP